MITEYLSEQTKRREERRSQATKKKRMEFKSINEWKDIPGYEGLYQVSKSGQVKRLDAFVNHYPSGKSLVKGRILKPGTTGRNKKVKYLMVVLSKNGKRHPLTVHRIVAEVFIKKIENKTEVNHINGIKTDNRVENLEWCTKLENMRHARDTGLFKDLQMGENHYNSKFTNSDVTNIKKLFSDDKISKSQIALKYSVTPCTIGLIINKKNWKHHQ